MYFLYKIHSTLRENLWYQITNHLIFLSFSQVQIWRRSFDVPPPPMTEEHLFYKEIRKIYFVFYSTHKYKKDIIEED